MVASPPVVPAKAGTHTPQLLESSVVMGPRLRGDDSGGSSLPADAARLDRAGPFLDLGRDELGEIFRASALGRHHSDAERSEPLAHPRRVDRLGGRLGELAHDRVRRLQRQHDGAQAPQSNSPSPASFADNNFGSTGTRSGPRIAMPFTVPASVCWTAVEICSHM